MYREMTGDKDIARLERGTELKFRERATRREKHREINLGWRERQRKIEIWR